ncbi:hypothetical protein [Devosia sp. Leaf64]|uniref:hypothetical protein n=1 Tax=Devosia sp. Leaf64 TaxID=1736229 RepID=UPI0007136C16|nr:hypothetical protein [Devosia sp. Leaf64]KQN78137.1 hypothetical protein ASE94_14155 [Devosia sp. Leaf64]
MQPFSLTYQVDFEDLFKASVVVARHRYPKAYRVRANAILYGTMVIGGALSAAGGIVLHNTVLPQVPDYVLIFVLFILVGIFYSKVMIPWLYRYSAKYVNAAHPRSPMQFTADDVGLRWKDDDIDFFLRWGGIEGVFATPESLSFLSGIIALVLPLDAFPDPATRKAFLTEVLDHITPEAAAKSRADKKLMALLA